jgi:pimeloyl-ACP methyl ester carboxylesterase
MADCRVVLAAIALSSLAGAQQRVSFPTRDGGRIYANLYEKGDRAVVLAHGGRFNKESWEKQAKVLAGAGFGVLAIDFRGEGQSQGPQGRSSDDDRYLDILAATHYMREAGARVVSVVGGSMGGDYAAEAAQAEPAAIDRLVLLAAGAYTPLTRMKGPKLFIVARDDANGEGLRLPKIRSQYEKALQPKELIVLDGSEHAQFLFETDRGERVMREILRFLSAP